jgi:hypothetical protein
MKFYAPFLRGSNNDAVSSQTTIDEDTSSYPVPHDSKERFDQIKCNYTVNLLPVYCRERFIPPEQTSDLLNGAVAELHVSLSHNLIRKPGESFDSFNGHIRQITIHAPGAGKPTSPYKRRNVREGPHRPPPASSSTKAEHSFDLSDDN